jgi:hypothetical protein
MNSLAGSIPARPRPSQRCIKLFVSIRHECRPAKMLNTLSIILTVLPHTTSSVHLDPLEQFDVLSVSFPFVGELGLTNLSLLLAFNIVLMSA